MLQRYKEYLSGTLHNLVDPFISRKFISSTNALCCIEITSTELVFVYIKKNQNRPQINITKTYPYRTTQELIASLKNIVKKYSLNGAMCSLMLQPDDYQLLVTDPLPVTDAEFQSAIRWKIKDLLRFPLDDVVIDHFTMPTMKNKVQKIMVVAALKSKLEKFRDQIEESGLKLAFIDIPELALRNIAALYEQAEQSTGLLYVQDTNIQLQIISQQQIYVSRTLKFSLDSTDDGTLMTGIERLGSELQRSLDYFQSLWDKPPISRFMFASTLNLSEEFYSQLSQRVRLPIQKINLVDVLADGDKVGLVEQSKMLYSIGGALRCCYEYPQEINLFSKLIKKSPYELNQENVLLAYGLFIALLALFYFGNLWQKHRKLTHLAQIQQTINKEQQQLSSLTQQYPAITPEDLKKQLDILRKQYDDQAAIIDVFSPNANFSLYLTGLAKTITPGVWLNEITFDRGTTKIQIKGFTLQPTLLEKFYTNLSNEPTFSNLQFEVIEIKRANYPGNFLITAKKANKL